MSATGSSPRRPPAVAAAAAAVAVAVAAVTGLASTPAAGAEAVHRGDNDGRPTVGIVASATGRGYWLIGADGRVAAFGDAGTVGATIDGVVAVAAHPAGDGAWVADAAGRVDAIGRARHLGDMAGRPLRAPVVAIAATPTGRGYWLAAADGGIFAFGDATFRGSMGGRTLRAPIVAMAASRTGRGYWLAAADGGIFAFGDATFRGSMGGRPLNAPVNGMVADPGGGGYLLVSADGGIFAFGSEPFRGSAGGSWLSEPVVGAARHPDGTGYWMVTAGGEVLAFAPDRRSRPAGVREAPPPGPGTEAMAAELFARINAERRSRGLPPLLWDTELAAAARGWSAEMARSGFRHSAMAASSDRYVAQGENIYNGWGSQAGPGAAHRAFMSSASHRDTIVSPAFGVVGIGVACGSDGRIWVTERFGALAAHGDPDRSPPPPGRTVATATSPLSC